MAVFPLPKKCYWDPYRDQTIAARRASGFCQIVSPTRSIGTAHRRLGPPHLRGYVSTGNVLTAVAPTLMQPKFINPGSQNGSSAKRPSPLLRLPTALPGGISGMQNRSTSSSLAIQEAVEKLMHMSMDDAVDDHAPSLIRGFKATIPSSELPKQRRRMIRGGLVDADMGYEKIGLKKLGDRARGLLTEGQGEDQGLGVGRRARRKMRRREPRSRDSKLLLDDLLQQAEEIKQDKENLQVRTSLLHSEIHEVARKIDVLEDIRRRLEQSVLRIQEEQLELEDELEGVQELMASPSVVAAAGNKALPQSNSHKSSRRRKGPAFLPSEHDELPTSVAFMVSPDRVRIASR